MFPYCLAILFSCSVYVLNVQHMLQSARHYGEEKTHITIPDPQFSLGTKHQIIRCQGISNNMELY